MPLFKHRPVRRASDWMFITKTRGVELINAVLLLAACATFYETKAMVAPLPKMYNAKHLDISALCVILLLLAALQWVGLFLGDRDKWRRVSALALTVSAAMYIWLATLIYYSSAWLTAIGVHRQALMTYIVMSVFCWLAADYIREGLDE